jgi:hypothetical protein
MSPKTEIPITLSVIILNWNVRELLQRALDSVFTSWGDQPGLEVIVVDNASKDDSLSMVREIFPEVHVIANDENRGYTGGNNQGIEAATGEYLLILNPDTEVIDDALLRLVKYAQQHPDVGLIGPQLLNPNGTVQSSKWRFPNLVTLFLESTWLQKFAPRRLLRHYYAQDLSDNHTHKVDWVTGAAMLVRREVVEQVGGLDENFFMYSEELDWCRRIKASGWQIVYYPKARLIHYEGKSSEQVVVARHIHFQSSKVYYARKYHGSVIAELLRLWLLGQYIWQMSVEGVKWLMGHRRDLRRARIIAYYRVLSHGLK